MGSFQSRHIEFIKRLVLIIVKESPGLSLPQLIQIRINSTTLNDSFSVKISLSVTGKVDFFGV